jgi:uncharacterized repeat protein (TIGR01451 family)
MLGFGKVVERVMITSMFVLPLAQDVSAKTEFASAVTYPVGNGPSAVVVGDFNGDGKLDLAVANAGSNSVSVLLGNGDGTFQTAVNFPAGNSPASIAMGDFNGDGKLDLVAFRASSTANGIAGALSILLGNGDGTFQAAKPLLNTDSATAFAIADFNSDEKSDLAISEYDSSAKTYALNFFLSNGDGTFQSAKQIPAPDFSGGLTAADFNKDSKADLAIATPQGVQILLGNGDGTFQQGALVADTANLGPDRVLAGDINGDGVPDLIVDFSSSHCGFLGCASTEHVGAFLNTGNAIFQSEQLFATGYSRTPFGNPPSSSEIEDIAVGDFNGDGRTDIAYRRVISSSGNTTSSLEVVIGKGDGSFSPAFVITPPSVASNPGPGMVAANLNDDKFSDLVALGTPDDSANWYYVAILLNTSPTSGADLDLLQAGASPEPVGQGATLTYSAEVFNEGPQNATNLTYIDTLPSGVNFISATPTQGSCVQTHGVVTCLLGSLASGSQFQVSVAATATTIGSLTNSMTTTSNLTDPDNSNNSATQTSTVVPVYTLTVTKSGTGTGTITSDAGVNGSINCGTTCSATFPSGTTVNVSANPDSNSLLAAWSNTCPTNGGCYVTISANTSLNATFVLGVTLNVAVSGNGSGSVTSMDGAINCSNTGGICSTGLVFPGTSYSLAAAPSANSIFSGWAHACTGTNPNSCNVTLNSNQNVVASFGLAPDFSLTAGAPALSTMRGGQATDPVTLAGLNGFSGTVALTCTVSGPSPAPTCSLSPPSIPAGAVAVTSTLTISTSALASLFPANFIQPGARPIYALETAILLLGFLITAPKVSRRRATWHVCGGFAVFLTLLLTSCGGGASAPPTENYTVTVTAKSGALVHSTIVTLTVN